MMVLGVETKFKEHSFKYRTESVLLKCLKSNFNYRRNYECFS